MNTIPIFANKSMLYRLSLCFIFLLSFFFRAWALGHANFQGDEIEAQKYIFYQQDLIDFLFSRNKGPGQYITTYIANLFSNYFNIVDKEMILRLPFMFVNMLSLFFSALITYELTLSRKNVLISTSLLGLSGLLIAFARISQYQSFVLLSSTICIWSIIRYTKDKLYKYIVISGLASAIGLLFHYDAISFILTTVFILYRTRKLSVIIRYLLITSLASLYYLPYIFNPNFHNVFYYLFNDRILPYFHYDSVFYSIKLMSVYHPVEYLLVLIIPGFGAIYKYFMHSRGKSIIYFLLLSILVIRYLSINPHKSLIFMSVCMASFLLAVIIAGKKTDNISSNKEISLIWFFTVFIIYGLLVIKPLTHIYNMIIPFCILASGAIVEIKNKYIAMGILFICFFGSVSFNYQAFIENNVEYPWQKERYIWGEMYTGIYKGEVVRGIFGFPYYRNLEDLEENITGSGINSIKTMVSNEDPDRVRYYTKNIKIKDNGKDICVYIKSGNNTSNICDAYHTVNFENSFYVILSKN